MTSTLLVMILGGTTAVLLVYYLLATVRLKRATREHSHTYIFYEPEDQVAGLVVKCEGGDVKELVLVGSDGRLSVIDIVKPSDPEKERERLFSRYNLKSNLPEQ